MASKEQIKRIYALGAKCGLLDRSLGCDDNLHLWVKQFSLKDHISELTDKQAAFIIERLEDFIKQSETPKTQSLEHITGAQQSMCFRLVYELARLSPSQTDPRERLRGIVEKALGRTIKSDGDIFYKVSRSEGAQVIEMLKRMIRTEKQKIKRLKLAAKRGDENGAGTAHQKEPP